MTVNKYPVLKVSNSIPLRVLAEKKQSTVPRQVEYFIRKALEGMILK